MQIKKVVVPPLMLKKALTLKLEYMETPESAYHPETERVNE